VCGRGLQGSSMGGGLEWLLCTRVNARCELDRFLLSQD